MKRPKATNEELDTAKEELQASNEELNTVNDELRSAKSWNRARLNSDLRKLLGKHQHSTGDGGTKNLHIRWFTATDGAAFEPATDGSGTARSPISTRPRFRISANC